MNYSVSNNVHPAILEEISVLRALFPGKEEMTLNEYAAYFGIGRANAARHFKDMNKGPRKIGHKRIGRKVIIPIVDFAFWLAHKKVLESGEILIMPYDNINDAMKRRRGFSSKYNYDNYRRLG